MVICLERCADLHMAKLVPLPLTVSCFSKIQIGLPFWYRLTRVVLDKGPLNGCVCVCACVPVQRGDRACCRGWGWVWRGRGGCRREAFIAAPLAMRALCSRRSSRPSTASSGSSTTSRSSRRPSRSACGLHASTKAGDLYPRDAMLARVPRPTSYDPVSLCVSLSVTSRCSIEMDGRNKLVFGR